MRAALVAAADRVVELPVELAGARRLIAAERLDALYYADIGMSALTYFLAFARLAPLQCLTWGHPDTTGIPNLDRFLSCDAMEPEGAERHYSETLVRLPGPTIHYARPALPARLKPRSAFGLPDDAHLYVCPQSLFKIHPDFDRALVELLRRDRQGLVVLLSGRDRNLDDLLRRRLARVGPEVVGRIRFLRQMPLPDFLSLVTVSDVMLDPLHYSGGNTSLEAFALGTPIVTWPGEFMRGRHTHGFYKLMDLDDCVAPTTPTMSRSRCGWGGTRTSAATSRAACSTACRPCSTTPPASAPSRTSWRGGCERRRKQMGAGLDRARHPYRNPVDRWVLRRLLRHEDHAEHRAAGAVAKLLAGDRHHLEARVGQRLLDIGAAMGEAARGGYFVVRQEGFLDREDEQAAGFQDIEHLGDEPVETADIAADIGGDGDRILPVDLAQRNLKIDRLRSGRRSSCRAPAPACCGRYRRPSGSRSGRAASRR